MKPGICLINKTTKAMNTNYINKFQRDADPGFTGVKQYLKDNWNEKSKKPPLKKGYSAFVLGYNKEYEEYILVYYHSYYSRNKKWRDENGNTADITHWQFLPNPPKQ